jgi:DNA uptake protein ComE-like DNA-binding protein
MRHFTLAALTALGLFAATPLMAQSTSTDSKMAPSSNLLDINTATPEQLDALPGIGKAYSAAIIKGRPYKGKDELVQKSILPQKTYDGIKDRIIAKQAKG